MAIPSGFVRTFKQAPLESAIAALLILLYTPLLWHWVDGWLNKTISLQHEYFSHGLIGIPFALYLAWGQRQLWAKLPDRWQPVGIGLVAIAAVFYTSGLPDWINLSLPLLLVGLCLCLKGTAGLQLQAFPLVLITLATPTQLPYLIEPYILPLQHLIASVAGFLLVHVGVDVTVQNVYLYVNGQTIEVAPHCAGLKMLFTSLYVALMLIHWTGLWASRLRTGLFLAGTVAISILGNILRNTVLSYFHGTGNDTAFDWLHESWGGDLYSALLLIALVGLAGFVQQYVPKSLEVGEGGNWGV
jgi:cyanoexosortase B